MSASGSQILHHYILCLGGNTALSYKLIADATAALSALGTLTADSHTYLSEAEGSMVQRQYHNRVVALNTDMPLADLICFCKECEHRADRRHDADGVVTLDIDIVSADGVIVRLTEAHAAYFRQGLTLAGIDASKIQIDL